MGILKYDEVPNDCSETKSDNKADRNHLLQGFVHMWDVGNGFRPWDVYKHLVASLEAEFFAQGDQEKALGLPVTMLMDREKDRLVTGQEFFLCKLVLPCFNLYASFMEEELVTVFRTNLEAN